MIIRISQFLNHLILQVEKNTPIKRSGKDDFVKQVNCDTLLDLARIWLFSGSPEFFSRRIVADAHVLHKILADEADE